MFDSSPDILTNVNINHQIHLSFFQFLLLFFVKGKNSGFLEAEFSTETTEDSDDEKETIQLKKKPKVTLILTNNKAIL